MTTASVHRRSAIERRQQMRLHAQSIGIDEAYISDLVDTFYERARRHPSLGPIFERALAGHWDAHLDNMKHFWASVALGSVTYSGRPVPAHAQHGAHICQEHFGMWLDLFAQTLEQTAPSPEAADYLIERAERIARSLRYALFAWNEIEPNGSPKP